MLIWFIYVDIWKGREKYYQGFQCNKKVGHHDDGWFWRAGVGLQSHCILPNQLFPKQNLLLSNLDLLIPIPFPLHTHISPVYAIMSLSYSFISIYWTKRMISLFFPLIRFLYFFNYNSNHVLLKDLSHKSYTIYMRSL